MGEPFASLVKTPAAELSPGDQGIGIMDMGDGQPFGMVVTVLHVEQGVATVQDTEGCTYRTPSLLAVGEDLEALLEAEEERAIQAYEEARRAM